MDGCMECQDLGRKRQKLARMARRLNARAPRGPITGLVLMTDDRIDTDWCRAAFMLPAGSAVIVRHRDGRRREDLARALIACCRPRGVRVLVSDDAKLAMRVRADGVHLPERRMMQVAGVRGMNSRWILSSSVHGPAGIRRARGQVFDILFLSPFMETQSHPGAGALGAVRFAALSFAAGPRVYALGGIDADTVPRLACMNVGGVGVIRAWIAP